jgi:phage baseplate assembly protein W
MNDPAAESSFLGRGWAFPPSFDHFSRTVGMVEGEDDIRQSISLILGIAPGERQMLPPFGTDMAQFVFGPLDLSVMTMIETELRSALLNYEPRINVEEISVEPATDNGRQAIIITIDYSVRSTNRRYNLVYPYYLNEATGIPS